MISVGYISPGTVASRFHESMMTLVRQDQRITAVHSLLSGPGISAARNQIVHEFLKTENQWLFMVDTDMVFEPDIIDRFLEHANAKIRPVIGGLCFAGGRVGTPFPTLYVLIPPEHRKDGKVTKVIANYPKDALCKVDATGAAALFIHRDVFLIMEKQFGQTKDGYTNPEPWFAEVVHQGEKFGEDWTFCMRLQSCKIPLYVHTGIKLGHIKVQNIDEQFYEEWCRMVAARQEEK